MKYVFLATLMSLLSGCSHLFYYPTDKFYYDPSKFLLSPQDVWLDADGEKIHAWYFEPKKGPSKGSLVFFHGNAENLTSHYIHLSWLPAEGYSFLIFDYPGYGRSSGKPTPESTVKAGMAAIEWMAKKDPRPLVVYGQSLGGAVAQRAVLELKDHVPFKGVVLDSTFNSYGKIARLKMSHAWFTWPFQPLTYLLLSDRWAAKDVAKISPIPVLVIHGTADYVVEPELGQELFEKLAEPKELWVIPGGSHTDVFFNQSAPYREKFLEWLAKLK
jgi:hypothetical protein